MQAVLPQLQRYIGDTFLDGDARELDATSPLLEWGVIDSMAMMELLAFIERRFQVRIPDEDVVPENFATLGAISELVTRRLAAR